VVSERGSRYNNIFGGGDEPALPVAVEKQTTQKEADKKELAVVKKQRRIRSA
jgi:hypothetical protein